MDPSRTTAEEMCAECGILDPAVRLLDQTAWTQFFYSRNTLLLPAASSGWWLERALPGLRATWKLLALTLGCRRGVYPQRKGAILRVVLLGVEGLKTGLSVI